MPSLSLSPEDAATLREVLQASLAELRRELWHTDSREFRELLRQRADTIERMIGELAASSLGGAAVR